jgi:hypothetical protein
LAFFKDLREFGIFEVTRLITHLGRRITIITNAKKILDLIIFQLGFVADLPWDPSKWSWRMVDGLSTTPFFDYFAKKGYKGNNTHCKEAQSFVSKL